MNQKIALLLQEHFAVYCRRELGMEQKDCSLTYFIYETLDDLQDIFLKNKEKYDGFITSGIIPLNALRDIDTPPYSVKGYFGGYLENTYRILLEHVLKRGGADPSRIGVDYLDDGSLLQSVLEQDRLPELVSEFENSVMGLSEQELEAAERRMVEKYLKQCREGELDFVVTYFHSVVEALTKEGVECYYSYPSRKSLIQTLELCIKNVRLEKIRRNISAVIRISPDVARWKNKKNSNQELEMLAIKGSLLEYCRLHHAEPVMKDDFSDVELYLNTEQIRKMTDQFTCFDLPVYLEEKTGFCGFIGIGSGEELGKARIHAMQARDYGMRLGSNSCIYIDEKEEMHSLPPAGVKEKPNAGIPASYVETIANRSHLSSETVYRVIAAMQTEQSDEFTAADLVRVQEFSLRIATRVLTALADAGYAEKIGQKRVGNKGRPQNLYRLGIEYNNNLHSLGTGHRL